MWTQASPKTFFVFTMLSNGKISLRLVYISNIIMWCCQYASMSIDPKIPTSSNRYFEADHYSTPAYFPASIASYRLYECQSPWSQLLNLHSTSAQGQKSFFYNPYHLSQILWIFPFAFCDMFFSNSVLLKKRRFWQSTFANRQWIFYIFP